MTGELLAPAGLCWAGGSAELREEDAAAALRLLPPELVVALQLVGEPWCLAGGAVAAAVARRPARDLDVFVTAGAAQLVAAHVPHVTAVDTEGARTLVRHGAPAVQLIHRWGSGAPEQVLARFDFAMSAAAVWAGPSGRVHSLCHPAWYSDVLARRLRHLAPAGNDTARTLQRLLKFVAQGYTVEPHHLASVVCAATGGDADALTAELLHRAPVSP